MFSLPTTIRSADGADCRAPARALACVVALALGCAVDQRDPTSNPEENDGDAFGAGGAIGAAGAGAAIGAPSGPGPAPGAPTPGAPDPSAGTGGSNPTNPSSENIDDTPLLPDDTLPNTPATSSGAGGLSVTPGLVDFAGVEVGTTSAPQTLTVRNVGTAPTGPLTLGNPFPDQLLASTSCGPSLAPGAECTIELRLTPVSGGAAQVSVAVGNDAVGFVEPVLRGEGWFRIGVELAGPAARVVSADGGIDCGATCSRLVAPGSQVELRAQTTNGSGVLVSSWSEAACRSQPRCTLSVEQSKSVRVTFRSNPNNLAFVSSVVLQTNLGGVAAYDRRCTELAAAAGVNSTGRFVALMSDSQSNVRDRLSAASRGWVGLDGLPFFDTFDSLVTDQLIYFPLRFDELGADYWRREGFVELFGNRAVWTGMDAFGNVRTGDTGGTCLDWTSQGSTAPAAVGSLAGGPILWSSGSNPCNVEHPIACLEDGKSQPLTTTRFAGKQIWVTDTEFVVGTMTPDAKCQQDKPASVATARAFISTTTRAAVDLLDRATTYVRADGLYIGTGAELARGQLPVAPIWSGATGEPNNSGIWTGSSSPTELGTAATTCDDWTNPSSTGDTGVSGFGGPIYWSFFPQQDCTDDFDHLYCFEQ